MSIIRIPPGMDREVAQALRDLETALLRVTGDRNLDFHGKRIMNAGSAVHDDDLVTMKDVKDMIAKGVRRAPTSILGSAAGGAPGSGGGGGGGGGNWTPTVPVPDHSDIVEAYAAAHPDQLADSCQDEGGSWDFMDGVVAELQAIDSRYGFNGKRADVNDPSHDAIAYYCGELSLMVAGSPVCFVFDIIGNHCGDNPSPAWINQTRIGSLGAAWLPNRP